MTMIPTKINVLGRVWTVEKTRLDDGIMGQTVLEGRRISLSETLVGPQVLETLYHELVHVALMETGVGDVLDDKQTEAVCDCVALVFSSLPKLGEKNVHKR